MEEKNQGMFIDTLEIKGFRCFSDLFSVDFNSGLNVLVGENGAGKDWIKDPDSEAARLAYVACSRPRHLLVLAIKKTTNEERETHESRGFCYYKI